MFQPNAQQNYTEAPYGVHSQQPQNGYVYSVARPQARNTQPLTQDQINFLRSDANQFSLAITERQKLIASCTHKEKNGSSSLIDLGNGEVQCTICGAKFHMLDLTPEGAQEIIKDFIDLLQTIKTLYVDASEEFIDKYMIIQVLAEKAPQLYDIACANFAKYEGPAVNPINTANYGNGFTLLAQTLANPYGMYGAPMYQQPVGYPAQSAQQPQAYGNPMAYGVPGQNTPAQQPAAPTVGTIPTAQESAPAAAQQPVQQAVPEVQQQQVFNV